MARPISALLPLAMAATLAACGSAVQPVSLRLVTRTCGVDPALDPLAGVNNQARVRVRVYGPGIDTAAFTSNQLVSAGTLAIPDIPAGNERRVVVEVTDGTTAANVVARG